MELSGFTVGVAGLLALYEVAAKTVHSVEHFSSESLQSRYDATKVSFDRWGKETGIARDALAKASAFHRQLQDQTAVSAIADLLKSIRVVLSGVDYTTARYHDNANHQTSTELHLRSRLQSAASESEKLSRQIDDFDRLVQKLYLLIPLEDLPYDQSQGLQSALLESHRSHNLDRILRWLDATISEDYFDAYCSTRLHTTCDWILKHRTYAAWLRGPLRESSKVLWIHGPSGYGKSVLCAFIIQRLRDTRSNSVYNAFCSADNELQRDPIYVLRAWIIQAVSRDQSVFEMVHHYLDKHHDPTAPPSCKAAKATHSDLWNLFQKLLSHDPSAIFIIDGLDECPRVSTSRVDSSRSRGDVLDQLVHLLPESAARLLVVSRNEDDIKAQIGPHNAKRSGVKLYELSLTKDLVAPDVARFAEHVVVQKLPGESDKYQQKIAAQMAEKSDGMFLMVRLQSRNLRPRKRKRNYQLHPSIDEMPTDLVRIYERDWSNIQNLSDSDRRRAETILRWVVFANRLLTIAELSEAVTFLDNRDEKYVHEEILALCDSFLELRPSNTPTVWDSHIVHLIHFSAVEFLLGQQTFSDAMSQSFYLGRHCLEYINNNKSWHVEEESQNPIRSLSFRKYASSEWYDHLRRAQHHRDKLRPQLLSFFAEPNPNWDNWRQEFESSEDTVFAASRLRAFCSSPGGRMYYACLFGFLEVVKDLHGKHMANINEGGGFYGNPVQAASVAGNMDVLQFLLRKNANIHEHGRYGSALHAAAAHDQETAALELLSSGASISATDSDGNSPLSVAAKHASDSVSRLLINRLIDQGVDLDVADNDGWTCLHWAAQSGDIKTFKLLLESGCSIELADEEGDMPLHISTLQGHENLVQAMLDAGADTEARDSEGYTALHIAASCGHYRTCQVLIKAGACLYRSTMTGRTPLLYAALQGDHKIVKLLLDSETCTTIPDRDGNTAPLMTTCVDNDGNSALHIAAEHGHLEAAKLLLSSRADPALPNFYGETPLILASLKGKVEIIQQLLKAGAKVSRADDDGDTALHCAAENGYQDIVVSLLACGADVSASNSKGWTPLHLAASEGYIEVVRPLIRALIEAGGDIDKVRHDGRTALQLAFYFEYRDIILLLLDKSASLDSLDLYGMAPWEYASAEFRATIPQCQDCREPTESERQQRAKASIRKIAQGITPGGKKDLLTLLALGYCILVLQDTASAAVVYDQTVSMNMHSRNGPTFHHKATYCEGCEDSSGIVSTRYACTICVDRDFCASCMTQYNEGVDFDLRNPCNGHQFLCIPSDAFKPEECTDIYTEKFVKWLKDLALRYQPEDS
ncbi:uncharacterized protein DSM5745_04383 [Aspergillus mulundensis]|uniref:NACHT domain-containing protein n=1 Tax=Aspergillus mulundensis TaxID=1810919 RepID=A0A3D8SCH6_9EURO|nr:hypothetical protein DSM5745_04383 [Aspergillus mulundensis]RDW84057.1 hypothetical protein DSM5745_04383 [Aspergillus mulundensis]